MSEHSSATLEERIQSVLDGYRPTLYMDGGDVQLLHVDDKGIAHIRMLGACIDCPVSLLTMKLGIQRLLKENFSEIHGINAITDLDISALYRPRPSTANPVPENLVAEATPSHPAPNSTANNTADHPVQRKK